MELSSARQEGFVPKINKYSDGTETKKRPLVVIGIMTSLGNKKKRDAVRQAWMGTGNVSPYHVLVKLRKTCGSVRIFFFLLSTLFIGSLVTGPFYCRCIIKKDWNWKGCDCAICYWKKVWIRFITLWSIYACYDDNVVLESFLKRCFFCYVVQIKETAWTRALMLKIVKPMT